MQSAPHPTLDCLNCHPGLCTKRANINDVNLPASHIWAFVVAFTSCYLANIAMCEAFIAALSDGVHTLDMVGDLCIGHVFVY